MSLLWSVISFLFYYFIYSWIRCVWCGAWFPWYGKPSYGPRTRGFFQCRNCGRLR